MHVCCAVMPIVVLVTIQLAEVMPASAGGEGGGAQGRDRGGSYGGTRRRSCKRGTDAACCCSGATSSSSPAAKCTARLAGDNDGVPAESAGCAGDTRQGMLCSSHGIVSRLMSTNSVHNVALPHYGVIKPYASCCLEGRQAGIAQQLLCRNCREWPRMTCLSCDAHQYVCLLGRKQQRLCQRECR